MNRSAETKVIFCFDGPYKEHGGVIYVIASSKPWHRETFERRATAEPHRWVYVENRDELAAAIETHKPRYVFLLHWNWLVPKTIWSVQECVCFHMTDVPYGRGGSPLQNLIKAGHAETKVTALRMVGEMDAGPVYAKRPLSLSGRAEEIYRRAGDLSWGLIDWIVAEQPMPEPQQGEPIVFKRRTPEQSALPETGTQRDIYDHIRMLDAPTYPLAFLDHGDFRYAFSEARMDGKELQALVTITRRPRDSEE